MTNKAWFSLVMQAQIVLKGSLNAFSCPNTKRLTNRRRLTMLAYVVMLVLALLVRTRLKCLLCSVCQPNLLTSFTAGTDLHELTFHLYQKFSFYSPG